MGFLSSDKRKKQADLITLQNIVMDIKETKLQVSEEFLDKMTKLYISRHMSAANSIIENMSKMRQISVLFKRFDMAIAEVDALILIEPYYIFKVPTPSKYKEMLNQNLEKYVNNLIVREWKALQSKSEYTHGDRQIEENYRDFFDSFTPYTERLTPDTLDKLNKMRNKIFPKENISDDAVTDAAVSEDTDNGFQPAEFETFTSEELMDKPIIQ
ncbi:MAG: hypothetical protein ACI4KF_13015 [Huintestinicola sp.]